MIAPVNTTGSIQAQYVYDFRKSGFLQILDAGAQYLGLTEDQLRDQLQGGKSLVEIAQARGKSADGLKSALMGVFPLTQKSEQLSAVLDRMMTEHPRIHREHRGHLGQTDQATGAAAPADPTGSTESGDSSGAAPMDFLG